MNDVEFVSYDGVYPCLCMGTLCAKVNGNTYYFHYSYAEKATDPQYEGTVWLPPFWVSGGGIDEADFSVNRSKWQKSSCNEYPSEVRDNLDRLLELFNEHVQFGCCGGCL